MIVNLRFEVRPNERYPHGTLQIGRNHYDIAVVGTRIHGTNGTIGKMSLSIVNLDLPADESAPNEIELEREIYDY